MSRTDARHRVNREIDLALGAPTERVMPVYVCHKRVRALRISAIEIHADGSATITPKEDGFAPFVTRAGWGERYGGTFEDPGVFVQYEDGFTSWSPTAAFDGGYAPDIERPSLRLSDRVRQLERDIASGAFDGR